VKVPNPTSVTFSPFESDSDTAETKASTTSLDFDFDRPVCLAIEFTKSALFICQLYFFITETLYLPYGSYTLSQALSFKKLSKIEK
jgi:hypothetical protein